ncbi:hypothetical protein HZA97_03890 [Candidatus Woesearchaeota archaeon]|nr:hypothetical protein [Candidatus Woesearchaeota archaeon]
MAIGFGAKKEKDESEESFESIKTFLRHEVTTVEELKEALSKELKEVEDLEKNLLVLSNQVEELNKVFSKREEIYNKLLSETNKRASQVDIEKCDAYLGMIREIDNNSLGPMLQVLIQELGKLKIEETHVLYQAAEENKKVMDELDKQARALLNEVHTVRTKLNSTMEEITKTYAVLEELREERTIRQKGKLGFGS